MDNSVTQVLVVFPELETVGVYMWDSWLILSKEGTLEYIGRDNVTCTFHHVPVHLEEKAVKLRILIALERQYPKCGYCGRRMCGALTGSTICEPDGYRSSYSEEERKILVEEWSFDPGRWG